MKQALADRRILITCGTGGVGKTTISAALALRAALEGRRAVVITVDPAKRLKTSLGLTHLGDDPTDLTERVRAALKSHDAAAELKGTLHAIVPDTRRTFESFVRELAPDESVARRIMDNPIFQIFAREFSGSNEYMALERLLAIAEERAPDGSPRFDCIILDTPPSRNTLAFLDAPRVLAQFFEERFVKWLVVPANKLVAAGMRKAMGILEKLTGGGFVKNLFDFASDLFEVQSNFTANLKRITAILESDQVGFVMVTTPMPEVVPEVSRFVEIVGEHRFHFDGIVLNRSLSQVPPAPQAPTDPAIAQGLALVEAQQAREKPVIEGLARNNIPVRARVPELARDVHSVEDLFHVAMALHD